MLLLLVLTLASPSRAEPTPDDNRHELGVLPALGGDTDVGFKFGAFAQFVRYEDGLRPYAWRAQVLAIASVKREATGTEWPYREAAVRVDWPRAGAPLLRPSFALEYLRTTNRGYYGIGNASHAERKWAGLEPGSAAYVAARRFYQFDGTTLGLAVGVIGSPLPFLRTLSSIRVERTTIETYPGSLLALNLANGVGAGERLYGVQDHDEISFRVGVAYDTRDHETVPTTGRHLQLVFRSSPGAFGADSFVGATLHLRSWFPLAGERLVVGARLIGDVVSQRAPLLELGRYGGFETGRGPGGGMGVRGLPDGRLLGRTKLIGNLEVRSMFLRFRVATERFTLGVASFADAGRVYTDSLAAVAATDGAPGTLHPGFGAGPRLRWGDALLIRADVAYAPLAAETGAVPGIYVDVGHVL
ncbi:MAG: BamA/TamA family outer membrane protein [Myxococcales bacterium]|nr:BamA/TamA family outer membrane protein [Myxococcales bacterium]